MKIEVSYPKRSNVSVLFEFSEEEREFLKGLKGIKGFDLYNRTNMGMDNPVIKSLEEYGIVIIGEESGWCMLSKLGESILGIK